MLDTLTMARRLTDAGMDAQQAEVLAQAFREFAERQLTPEMFVAGLDALRSEMRAENEKLRSEMQELRSNTRADINAAMLKVVLALATLWAATFFASLYFISQGG